MDIFEGKIKLLISSRFFTPIVFILIFLIGLNVYKDYGVYGDEPVHQYIGNIYFNYVKSFFLQQTLNNEHYQTILNLLDHKHLKQWIIWPVSFELPTEFLFHIFNIQDTKEIFQLRHLINFLILFVSLIFFYALLNERFESKIYSITGVLFLFFSPRIFGDIFYNTKDIFFLSLTIINIYVCIKFIKRQNLKNSIYFVLSSGILIATRIFGVLFPLMTIFIIIFKFPEQLKNKIFQLIILSALILILSFFLWPYLWIDPVNNFLNYLEFFNSSHIFYNLYLGEYIASINSPWHYTFLWISITTPTSILFLSFVGIFLLLFYLVNKIIKFDDKNDKLWTNSKDLVDFYLILSFILIIISILKYKNNFDGWRHMYFIYPYIIFFSIFTLNKINSFFKKTIIKKIINYAVFLNLIIIFSWNYFYHPYQYVYFNFIQKNIIKKDFDLDYFGLSLKPALENIASNDKKEKILVAAIGDTYLEGSILILNKKIRNKFKVVYDINESDYVIDIYKKRFSKKEKKMGKDFLKFNEIVVDGKVINTTYKRIK